MSNLEGQKVTEKQGLATEPGAVSGNSRLLLGIAKGLFEEIRRYSVFRLKDQYDGAEQAASSIAACNLKPG